MAENAIFQQFKKLEDRVEQLVGTCRDLKNAKTVLEEKIRELEGALKKDDTAAQRYDQERSMIRSRIDDLLGKVDQALG